ncbi:hypothetical protein BV898_06517 [Hypsibius exemplaris]|uniref:Gustatory receptor n=1 Tax=Hypsibius exemplaris TaxID=2072580 RepID=A0A1W0WWF3_HYPEX|nr:hypothetical protein BV898_06517 [Hypsibius exemplaris]
MSDDSQAIHKRSSNSLITALEDFQSVFICLRGPVVLYMFFKNRHAFKEVERLSHRIVHLAGKTNRDFDHLNAAWIGIFLFVALFWDVMYFYEYYPANSGVTATTLSQVFNSIHFRLYFWEGAIMWLFMCTLPFCLSQSIYIIVWINGKILAEATEKLRHNVIELIGMSSADKYLHRDYCLCAEKLQRQLEVYVELFDFIRLLTDTLGSVYLAMYILDVVSMLSFVGVLAGYHLETPAINILVTLLGSLVFALYVVFVATPFAKCHQQGRCLFVILDTFRITCEKQPITFYAGHVLHVTTGMILKTLTYVASIALIVKELLIKSEESLNHHCPEISATNINTNQSLRE